MTGEDVSCPAGYTVTCDGLDQQKKDDPSAKYFKGQGRLETPGVSDLEACKTKCEDRARCIAFGYVASESKCETACSIFMVSSHSGCTNHFRILLAPQHGLLRSI